MASVGVVVHHVRPRAAELAGEIVTWLEARGHDCRLPTADAALVGSPDRAVAERDLASGLDLAVSVGGDGTMLRTVDLVAAKGVPVLGVNVGHLGYLTEVEPDGWAAALEAFLAGAYTIEERTTLEVVAELASRPSPAPRIALNEAVLKNVESSHTVRLALTIGGEPFLTYAADGIIVATATGSTAYNLSARGPVLSPRLDALVVTPVAAHMLFDRSLVLAAGEPVAIEVLDGPPAGLLVDGSSLGMLEPGDAVRCAASAVAARLVTFGERDFRRILKAKFGLADR